MIKRLPNRMGQIFAGIFAKKLRKRRIHVPCDFNHPAINLVSSWNEQCGIATYSQFLADELKKKAKLYVTVLPKRNPLSPFFFFLGRNVARSQDIVHVEFEYGLFSSLEDGRRTLTAFAALPFYLGLSVGDRHVVTTMHEPRKTVATREKRGLLYTRLLDKLVFTVSDVIVVHTLESKELLHTIYAVKQSKIRVIPHGSYQNPIRLDKEEAKRKLGLAGKTVVTVLGFVTPKKGHDLVVPLMPQINPNVQLVIAGGPQTVSDELYMQSLKELAEQSHCLDRVTFTGYLTDLTVILNATDIAVLPYRFVSDSGVLHLLVSYQVPIVASNLGAFEEVYREYGCLMLFENGNPRDLLAKLESVINNQKLRKSLSSKCAEMWNATKWSNIAERHIEIYREVLASDTQSQKG